MVGQLAEVVAISHGTVMSYAVQVQGDSSLFGKIEWLLKTQFTFSVVERNFNEVTFRLVQSLCEDSNTEMAELPECGVCESVDPFPVRATAELADSPEPLHLAFCSRCAAQYAVKDEEQSIRALVGRDRSRLRVGRDVPVVEVPEMVEPGLTVSAEDIRIAI